MGFTLLLPESYQATAIVRVVPPKYSVQDPYAQTETSQALARTYAELFKSPNVFEAAVDRGRSSVSPDALARATTVSYVEGTDLIRVQVESQDPRQARSLANLLANTFIEEKDASGGQRLTLADPASSPLRPVSPSMPLDLALALLLGTGVAVGGVFLLHYFGIYPPYSPEEVEQLVRAPILASLPYVRTTAKGFHQSAALEEAISTLRVNLNFDLDNRQSRRVVLISSALPGEGKTLVSTSLATSYARAGYECLIIDAVLRKPQVHDHLSVSNLRGLSHILLEDSQLLHKFASASKPADIPNLTVLTGGEITSNPVDLLSSARARNLICDLRERFDTAILDSPPAFPLVDASILGSQVDGIILVVDARKNRRRGLLRAVDQLRRGKGRILGVVLNFVAEEEVAVSRS